MQNPSYLLAKAVFLFFKCPFLLFRLRGKFPPSSTTLTTGLVPIIGASEAIANRLVDCYVPTSPPPLVMDLRYISNTRYLSNLRILGILGY